MSSLIKTDGKERLQVLWCEAESSCTPVVSLSDNDVDRQNTHTTKSLINKTLISSNVHFKHNISSFIACFCFASEKDPNKSTKEQLCAFKQHTVGGILFMNESS